MQLYQQTFHHRPVPTALVGAAIDFVLVARPAPDQLELEVATLSIRLGYSADIAMACAARIAASIRLFADPAWSAIRELRASLDLGDSLVFVLAAQRFIASASLREGQGFNVNALTRSLMLVLPADGAA